MAEDWRKELIRHPKLLALEKARRERVLQLNTDKQFILESERLKNSLEQALASNPQLVRSFFKQFYFPLGVRLKAIHAFLQQVKNHKLQALLSRYIRFVARFGAVMQPHTTKIHFSTEILVPWGTKFHVRLVDGHFEPPEGGIDDDAPFEYFLNRRL